MKWCKKQLHEIPEGTRTCPTCRLEARRARTGYDPDLCRKQLHPKSLMESRPSNPRQRYCPGCREMWEKGEAGQNYRKGQSRAGYSVKVGAGDDDEVMRKIQLTCGHEYLFKMCHLPKSWESPWCMACREWMKMLPLDQWKSGRLVRC